MIDPELALRLTGAALAYWGVLTAVQGLLDRDRWRDEGALGWPLQRLRRGRWTAVPGRALIWSQRGLSVLLVLQLFGAAALLVTPDAAAFAAFWLVTLLLALRFGPDGADKMVLVTSLGAGLQALGLRHGQGGLWGAGVLWTGGQLTIAYFAAGASKLALAPWRRGAALRLILSSYTYGHRWAAAALRGVALAAALSWAVMLAEALFPLALLLPTAALTGVLAGFFAYHLTIAVTMRLNTYPWAFLAAYPSVLLLGWHVRHALGWS